MRTYRIAFAQQVNAKHYPELAPLPWDQFVAWLRLDNPADHKECGGYVLGELQGQLRRKDTILSRSAVALDADHALPSFVLDSTLELGVALAFHTTWSHTLENPRYRMLAPLSRDVSPDEYWLITEALMETLGRDQFDPSSSEPSRMMFRPSTQGGDYQPAVIDGEPLDVDEWLALAKELGLADKPADPGLMTYDGPTYDELDERERAMADAHVHRQIEHWRDKLATAEDWPEGQTDDDRRGWEALSRDGAWAFAKIAAAPWTVLDEDSARDAYSGVLPDAIATDENCRGKWYDGIVAKATTEPIEQPPWVVTDFDPVADDPSTAPVDVTNESDALKWLAAEVGRGRLSGVFRRGLELVHTPRIGEHGYVEPKDERDEAGPAQVRRIDALELARRVDHGYTVTRQRQKHTVPSMFPQSVAARAASATDLLGNVRNLRGVTHTPIVLRDGSILDVAGYDAASGMLYLPDASLTVPKVSDQPTRAEVKEAGELLLSMVEGFPFLAVHDRANYLGALLTPLLRPLVPPPYKLVAIGAPQQGSGKSLLASILREVHGGVFKSEFPTNDDELRKFITSTLDATTAPVVQFDNVAGVLKSSVLDGLLTSSEWSDRLLGQNQMLSLANDRLWIATGNNVHIGGDLERRTLWVTINANMEHPETRTGFKIPDLEGWVREHRGKLLWALLTMIRAWVVAGAQEPERPTSDGFGRWVAVLRGILDHAELGEAVGVVGHEDTAQGKADPEDEEWAVFLAAAHRVFGSEPWTTSDLLDRTTEREFVNTTLDRELVYEELPGDIAEKLARSKVGGTKSLGKWLGFRDKRWAGGLSVQHVGDRRGSKLWLVVDASELLL